MKVYFIYDESCWWLEMIWTITPEQFMLNALHVYFTMELFAPRS